MKVLFTMIAAAALSLTAGASSLSEKSNFSVSDPDLVYHTAAPGMVVMPRNDMSNMVVAYDVSFIPREGVVFIRWGSLDENGEGEGLWTKWRDCADDDVISFTTPGIYVIEVHAEAPGKERSSTLKATFKVEYLGMSSAPGITLTPVDQRGYLVTLTSLLGDEIYYRWRHYDDGVWYKWRLYTEAIPYTEASKYVMEAQCNNDPLSVYIEVPSVDFFYTGDVNHNGIVNIEDLTVLIDMLLDREIPIGTGDVNKDGTVSIPDVAALIDILLK